MVWIQVVGLRWVGIDIPAPPPFAAKFAALWQGSGNLHSPPQAAFPHQRASHVHYICLFNKLVCAVCWRRGHTHQQHILGAA